MSDVSYTIGAGPLLLGAIIVAGIVGLRRVHRGDPPLIAVLSAAAIVYIATVLALTVFPIVVGRPAFSMAADPLWRNSVNLTPFTTIRLYLRSSLVGVARVNLLGNLALLAPLGVIVPVLWRRLDRWWRIAFAGVTCSVLIEMLQFARRYVLGMPGRSVDIDDVILNTVGVVLGFALYRIGSALLRSRRPVA